MSFNYYTPINKLNPSKIKWNIRVRVQALWKGITRETKEFRGLNLILVDDSKFRIHAFVNARFAVQFENELEEGQIYNLSDFIVQEYSGVEFHRCVRFDKHIYFADYTKLQKSTNDGLKICKWSFDFFELVDLEKMQTDKRFLCDVVSVIQEIDPILEYVNDNKEAKKQKKFSITDGRCTVKVTFFYQLAESFEEALKKEVQQKNIVIISSVKIGSFQGELNLTNYPATRFYINVNHRAVKELSKRASEPLFYQPLPVREEQNTELLTVNEVKNLGKEDIERQVVCDVTIKKVEEDFQWYDRICRKCNVEVHVDDGRFKCDKCKRFYTWPPRRFRVCVLCSDHTGVIPIILGDLAIRRLTSKTFFDIDLDLAEGDDPNKFPQALSDLKNKHFYVTLKISKENINNESDGYEASDIGMENENLFDSNTLQESQEAEDDSNAATETNIRSTMPQTQTPRSVRSKVKKNMRPVLEIKEKKLRDIAATDTDMESTRTANSTVKNLVRKSPEAENNTSHRWRTLKQKKATPVTPADTEIETPPTVNSTIKKTARKTSPIPIKNIKIGKKNKGKRSCKKTKKITNLIPENPLTNEAIEEKVDEQSSDEGSLTLSHFQKNRKKKGKESTE